MTTALKASKCQEKTQAAHCFWYAEGVNSEMTKNLNDIVHWMNWDSGASDVSQIRDQEIVSMVIHPTEDK